LPLLFGLCFLSCGDRERKEIETAPPTVRIVHSGQACNVEEERYSERVYTIKEGETLELQCLVTGHPRPQIRWTKTAGGASDRESSLHNETLRIQNINRHQGGRYYCKAENGLGSPAIRSIRVDVYCKNPDSHQPRTYLNGHSCLCPLRHLLCPQMFVFLCPLCHVGLRKGRFWITPDPYHNDDNIQIGREVKISCQVEATPPEELQFSWLKNGRPLRSSERMVITHTDTDVSPGTTNLDIIDLKFTDFGTYTCVASLRNGGTPEISIDVNISSTTEKLPLNRKKPPAAYCQKPPWLCVAVPPAVEPEHTEIRQALGRAFSLTCRLLRAHPARLLRYEWKLGTRLLTVGQFSDQRDDTNYHVRALNREGYGEYTCDITNEAGAGRCTFLVTGKANPPEFYYDTYSALWQSRPRVYGFKLQWTQMEPNAVDRILAYRLGIRQMGQSRWWEQEIPMEGTIQKGELLTYNLTELIKPESYLVRLTPITRYGEGDSTERIITYSGRLPPLYLTSDPDSCFCDLSGFYMYIETSRPRLEDDTARLLSPTFNSKSSSVSNNPTYCFAFYYHMYGKHIGALNVFLRQKGQAVTDTLVWSLTGNQGDRWRQAKVKIHPTTAFQMVIEGVRGSGIEGDIAIDDVAIEEGECKDPPPNSESLAPPSSPHIWQHCITLILALIGQQR
uniref:MAM domain containing glycosylphosphatidylinositol anchor 2a n=1 Tax=Pundamilia nyererei TaxID=303518 RepID=A0A3B4H3B1_9CICH